MTKPFPVCSLAILLFMCLSSISQAQILNVDRNQGSDSTGKRFFAVIGISASADKQKKELVDVSNAIDLTYMLPRKLVSVFKASTDFTTNGSDIIQNSGFFHFRIRDDDYRKLYPEVFSQYQWNGVLGMEKRILLGSNMRWKAIDKDANKMFMGLGLMFESERWNYNGVPSIANPDSFPEVSAEKYRLNHYVKWSWRISEKTDFVLANFTQMPTGYLLKPRIATNATINFSMFKWLGLALSYDSIYDTDPPVPISRHYYSLKGQLNLVF